MSERVGIVEEITMSKSTIGTMTAIRSVKGPSRVLARYGQSPSPRLPRTIDALSPWRPVRPVGNMVSTGRQASLLDAERGPVRRSRPVLLFCLSAGHLADGSA